MACGAIPCVVLYLQVPESVRKILAPFQMDGVDFVLRKEGRAMIADEMGLGKTIQASFKVAKNDRRRGYLRG